MKWCGRLLLLILLTIQHTLFLLLHVSWPHENWLRLFVRVPHILFLVIIIFFSGVFAPYVLFERSLLFETFLKWQLYIIFVLVPNTVGISGFVIFEADRAQHLPGALFRIALCITPILLILLLTTAEDSFSSKSNQDLVRNLSVLMVIDLLDAFEILDKVSESNAPDSPKLVLVLGAAIFIIVSSLQMYEYASDSVWEEAAEELRHIPSIIRNIFVLVINLVFLLVRLSVLIEYEKTWSILIIFKNFIVIILSVIHICSLTPRT